jgi:hypothetical protein
MWIVFVQDRGNHVQAWLREAQGVKEVQFTPLLVPETYK